MPSQNSSSDGVQFSFDINLFLAILLPLTVMIFVAVVCRLVHRRRMRRALKQLARSSSVREGSKSPRRYKARSTALPTRPASVHHKSVSTPAIAQKEPSQVRFQLSANTLVKSASTPTTCNTVQDDARPVKCKSILINRTSSNNMSSQDNNKSGTPAKLVTPSSSNAGLLKKTSAPGCLSTHA